MAVPRYNSGMSYCQPEIEVYYTKKENRQRIPQVIELIAPDCLSSRYYSYSPKSHMYKIFAVLPCRSPGVTSLVSDPSSLAFSFDGIAT